MPPDRLPSASPGPLERSLVGAGRAVLASLFVRGGPVEIARSELYPAMNVSIAGALVLVAGTARRDARPAHASRVGGYVRDGADGDHR